MDEVCKIKRRIKGDCKIFGLNNGKVGGTE